MKALDKVEVRKLEGIELYCTLEGDAEVFKYVKLNDTTTSKHQWYSESAHTGNLIEVGYKYVHMLDLEVTRHYGGAV